ncbi:TVP38/TMEM64 family protein [Phycicoccus sp. BSK3Z-2]|uniref:TVP38/TMEM64 family membrane protein n=1 Tax=Phycicoccus avicenniae TaxID=2828860 RepID=A0A941DC64_9MICO|nr:VTT domain-containing protein [Phycicoccus avicenniae]MBR7744287.1 TVP38/TMEM64 family protein [Phycicoccus avicenniae]
MSVPAPDVPAVPAREPAVARLGLLGLLLGTLVAGAVAVVVLGGDLDAVRAAVRDAGPWGPAVFVVAHVLLTLAPVPKSILVTIAGALFGVSTGVVVAWVAAVVSALVGFAVARRLGREPVARVAGPRLAGVQDLARDQGVLSVVVLRLTPVVPFTIVNYACGVSAVSRRDYVVGTLVGVVPGTVAYTLVGASAVADGSVVLLGVGAAVLLLVVTGVVARRLRGAGAP